MSKFFLAMAFVVIGGISGAVHADVILSVGDIITHAGERISCGVGANDSVLNIGKYPSVNRTCYGFTVNSSTTAGFSATYEVNGDFRTARYLCNLGVCTQNEENSLPSSLRINTKDSFSWGDICTWARL